MARRTTPVLLSLVIVALAGLPACVAMPGSPLPAKVTTTTRSLPPAVVRPDPDHVATLTRVLDTMKQRFSTTAQQTPGPVDVFDYGIGDLWTRGIDGTGTTIALVEGWNDARINQAIQRLDTLYGLPAPDIQTIYPTGNGQLPAKCPPGMEALGSYGSCEAWAGELTLDVEAAHLVAPYARILLVVAPADSEITDDAASQVAPPEMMQAVENVSDHHLADVISISDDTGESTYSHGPPEIHAQDPGELTAAADGVPVLVGTGDCGVVQNLAVASSQCGDTTTKPDTAAWDDSPWVTAVGGSVPNLDPHTGARLGPDPVWQMGRGAEGAGFSAVYPRPAYQNGVNSNAMRSVPDITMNAVLGTSEATPLFAGVLALATQLNHGVVGPVNDALYQLGPKGARAGIADVVSGSNSVPGAHGFSAAPGFDVASGWGTVDASRFVPALVDAVRAGGGVPNRQAAAELDKRRHGIHLAGGQLSAGGFLPRHPVRLAVDGRQAGTLTADVQGQVTDVVDPAKLGLAPGEHTVTLAGMLLTETTTFRSH